MRKEMNKKAAEMTIGTIIIIVLALVVLVILIFGFTTGWTNLWEKITSFGGGENNVQSSIQACQLACTSGANYDYCTQTKDLTGLTSEDLNKIKLGISKGYDESYDPGSKLDNEKKTASVSCKILENSGYVNKCSNVACGKQSSLDNIDLKELGIEIKDDPDISDVEEGLREIEGYFGSFKSFLLTLEVIKTAEGIKETMENEEIPIDEQTEKDLAEHDTLAKKEFFNKISLFNKQATPDNPLIILLGDTHGSPEIEKGLIEEIKKEFGINFVGLEGWAGKEANNGRKTYLLNAEEDLIKTLIDNSEYQILGLEEIKTQEVATKAFNLFKAVTIIKIKTYMDKIIKRTRNSDIDSFLLDEKIDADYRLKFKNLYTGILDQEKEFKENYLRDYEKPFNFEELKEELEDYFSEEGVIEYLKAPSWKIKGEGDKESPEYLLVSERSKIGSEKMLKGMENQKVSSGIMIYGRRHIPSIINEFEKNCKECSLIVFD